MLYLGERLDAGAALAAGLVNAVHDPDDVLPAALVAAARVARRSWGALELTKLALRPGYDATAFDVTAQALLVDSQGKRDRMGRFPEKRAGRRAARGTP